MSIASRGGWPPSLPYKVDTSRPSLHTNWTRLDPFPRWLSIASRGEWLRRPAQCSFKVATSARAGTAMFSRGFCSKRASALCSFNRFTFSQPIYRWPRSPARGSRTSSRRSTCPGLRAGPQLACRSPPRGGPVRILRRACLDTDLRRAPLHRSPFWPKFSTLVGAEVVGVRCGRASVRLRDYCEPLFSFEGLAVPPPPPTPSPY